MTSSMLRRQLKNLVQNFSEAEVKVREATSNDPWGPSSSQMADISDLTYNVVACNEIMTMLWKRLKDDKNWRHVHKSLTLLEYLLKTGSDRVLLKLTDNVYIVKALTEFRFTDKDGKDQGVNVREKAKVVLALMEDEEKLKEERESALKTREKTSKNAAASSTDPIQDPNYKPVYVPGASGLPSLDNIPSVADLAASFAAKKEAQRKAEFEKKEAERRGKMTEDELQWEDAAKEEKPKAAEAWGGQSEEEKPESKDPWGAPSKEPTESPDLWGAPSEPASEDAWGAPSKPTSEDAWGAPSNAKADGPDPFEAPKDDSYPFTALKDDSDPFSAPKDDPFSTPKDGPDPFSSRKDGSDPFSAPKDDPFSAPVQKNGLDPFSAPKDDPFSAPAPKNGSDPFSTPKDDPFSAPVQKDGSDPFTASKDDPFTAPSKAPKDSGADPFAAPPSPPKNETDPFAAPSSPPTADAWGAPADASDLWGVQSEPLPEKKADPWDASPTADLFGDNSKPDDDPWGAPATAVPPSGDTWGSAAPPAETSPSDDPWGDGRTTTTNAAASDPWGTPSNGTDGVVLEEEPNKPESFLGAGASLVDMDSLLSSKPKPKQPPLNALASQKSTEGALRGPGMAGPMGRTISITGVSPTTFPLQSPPSPFGSTPEFYGIKPGPCFEPPNPMLRPTFSQLMPHPFGVPQPNLPMPPMGPQMAPTYFGAGVVQPSQVGGVTQVGHLGASTPPVGGGVPLQPHLVFGSGLGQPTQNNSNPFLF
ncbi:epsin-1 [Osmerus mordax]|uniref:epsin-1 n=1 Tax=Osmerus mordax TaxID=8014 RepID=UPI00350EF1AE